ncbi:unnamed protein product, partial [Discosporangium mesarthrocarpum]
MTPVNVCRTSAMFEDSFKNLRTAKNMGMSTIFVQSETGKEEGVTDEDLPMVDVVVHQV